MCVGVGGCEDGCGCGWDVSVGEYMCVLCECLWEWVRCETEWSVSIFQYMVEHHPDMYSSFK